MGGKSTTDLTKNAKGISVHGNSLRVSFQYQGKRVRETLALEPTKANINHASRLRSAVMHDIAIGCFDYEKYFPESKNAKKENRLGISNNKKLTVEELAKKYIKLKNTDIGIQTERVYKNSLTQCVNELGADTLFSSITGEHILQMRSDLLATRKARTVNSYLVILNGFLDFSYENGYTNIQLSKFAKPLKTASNDPDPFEIEEYLKITASCLDEADKNWITLAVYTGLRTGELCALSWEDVDLKRRTIKIKRTITSDRRFKLPKTYEQRTVILLPPAIEALKKQQCKTYLLSTVDVDVHQVDKTQIKTVSLRPVFRPGMISRQGKKEFENWYTTSTLYNKWVQIVERSGVRFRTQYHTRHTYACWSITSHGNLAFIAEQMGHKDLTMLTKVYGKWMSSSSEQESDFIWSEMSKKGHDTQHVKMSQK